MKLRKLLVVLFVLVCVVSLACFTACKDGGDVNDDGAGDQITDGGNDNVGDNNGGNDNVQPEQPEDPEEPEVPTDPEEPEVPTDPEEPEVPTDPEEPEVPTDPEEPEVPTDPEDPEVPTDPEEPEDPTDPEDPEVPTDPEEPEVPTDPEDPEVPTDPEDPEDPTDPEDPEVDPEQPEQPEVSGTTIYFKSENGWTNANIYSWVTGGTITEAWPGSAMTSLGDGWFSYTFAEGIVPTNIIFNNGTAQTADLVFDGTNNYYAFNTMTGGTWGTDNTVSAPVQESDCYLRGNVGVGETDWGIGKAMTYNGTDEYSITVTVDAGAEVKIVYQNNWIGSELIKDGVTVAIEKPAGGNIKFTEAGTYTIYYKVTGDNTGIWIAAVEAEA